MPVLKINLNQQCPVLQTNNCKKQRENIRLTSEKKFYLLFPDIYIHIFLFARIFWETESFKYSCVFLVLELVIADTAHNCLGRF